MQHCSTKKTSASSSIVNRSKGEKWSQAEMETLVSLCVSHGRNGILSRETNKATILKKHTQWAIIMNFYNSQHPSRDKKALVGRYKFIVMHLRKNNVLATGGGLSTLSKEKTPFAITGPFLELSCVLGISVTGMSGFGSDTRTLDSNKAPVTDHVDEPENTYADLVKDPEDSLPKTVKVESELADDEVVVNSETESVPPANSSDSVASISATHIPSRSQYFSTQAQRRTSKRNINAVSDTNSERRKDEKHAAVMKYHALLIEAKIKEWRENKKDRQLARDRSAELHKLEVDRRAMRIHHQQELFSIQKSVLLAQHDAVARVSAQNVLNTE